MKRDINANLFIVVNICLEKGVSLNFIKILFQPKSLTSFLVAVGVIFLFVSGLTLEISEKTSEYFSSWGNILLIIGLIGWGFFIIPAILRNLGK